MLSTSTSTKGKPEPADAPEWPIGAKSNGRSPPATWVILDVIESGDCDGHLVPIARRACPCSPSRLNRRRRGGVSGEAANWKIADCRLQKCVTL